MECQRNINKICEQIGEDLNSPVCQEIREHLEKCPRCYAYVDSIKKTIFLYQHLDNEKDVPDSVDKRLWKVLNLECPWKKALKTMIRQDQ